MIVYACQDLMFATKIRSTAEALGIPSRPARDVAALEARLERVDDGRLNLPVTAVMIDLELGDAALDLIARAKALQAQLPVIAFGSHVAAALLQRAHDLGADFVMARSQFTATLPDLLRRFGAEADPREPS